MQLSSSDIIPPVQQLENCINDLLNLAEVLNILSERVESAVDRINRYLENLKIQSEIGFIKNPVQGSLSSLVYPFPITQDKSLSAQHPVENGG